MRFGMQLEWLRKVTLCGFCVHCTLYSRIHLADFLLVFVRQKSANSSYGVKKISIKWLWPVKVTLEIIKRRPKVSCRSCDEDPLKWDKKNLPSLQFVLSERMSLLSPLSSNGRSIPLMYEFADSESAKLVVQKIREISSPFLFSLLFAFVVWVDINININKYKSSHQSSLVCCLLQ